jgi:AcrR family transcriptional regulator
MTEAPTPRQRVLAAAFGEFAAHGVAGARISRIAEAAKTSKERVYAYFDSKEDLYAAVAAEQIQAVVDSVTLDVRNVPGYVGALFDYYVTHPDHLRLQAWARLEGDRDTSPQTRSLIAKVKTIADAQAAGLIPDDIPALDILMMLRQLATAWPSATELHSQADPADPAVIAERRSAVVTMATRLFPPTTGSA